LGRATAASATAAIILVLIPLVVYVVDPVAADEMMAGRRMAWGLAWMAATAIATAMLVVVGVASIFRRVRQR
jgi:hypothetical protein